MSIYRLLLPTSLLNQFNALLPSLGLQHCAGNQPFEPGVLSHPDVDNLVVETYDLASTEIAEWLEGGAPNTAAILPQHERQGIKYSSETPLSEALSTAFGINTPYSHAYEITKPADLRAPLRMGTNYPDFFNAFRRSVGAGQEDISVEPLRNPEAMLRMGQIDFAFAPVETLPAKGPEKRSPQEKPDGLRPIRVFSDFPSKAALVTNHPDHPLFNTLKQWLTAPLAP